MWISTNTLSVEGKLESVSIVVLSPSGSSIAIGFENGDIIEHDIAAGGYHANSNNEHKSPDHDLPVKSLAYSPNDSRMVSNHNDKIVTVWNPTSKTRDIEFFCCYELDPEEQFHPIKMSLSPNGELLILGSSDGTIRILDITSKRPVFIETVNGYSGIIKAISYLPESKQLIVMRSSEDAITISSSHLCHIQTLSSPYEAQGQGSAIQAVAFSSDSRVLVSSNKSSMVGTTTIRVWRRPETEHSTWTLQQTFDIDTECKKLVLSQDHQYFQTNKGPLWIDPLFMGGSSPTQTRLSNIQVKRDRIEWGPPDNRKVMLFLPNHRPTSCDVYDNNIVMVNESGRATFMELT
ncbi:hypothetical protein BELL_0126g00220 [Botrytis elliptica]|uniref:Uncharacterized protein n=1 Tax=Botrytis elliptica TaxID=278938 RepID=A0A4Z1K6T6_9HELO|nr:hypothetical protein EAE99_005521 [Botrytis elliptica]TGO77043.1 hypothetical protein BELL_0126g00220 [Botrytis elliptica]